MEAIKIRKKIKSSTLLLKNLDKFKGQDVEILILSDISEHKKDIDPEKTEKKAGGSLKKFSNPKLRKNEKYAWELAVRDKYDNS